MMESYTQDQSQLKEKRWQDNQRYENLPGHEPNAFFDIINSPELRSAFYQKRINDAWQGLQKDITRWKNCFQEVVDGPEPYPTDRLVYHHINQFEIFVPKAFDALMKLSQTELKGGAFPGSQVALATDREEAEDFRAFVVGVFTAQWLLFRDVIFQRVIGSPYREGLSDLDQNANSYYARLYNAINGKFDETKFNERYRTRILLSFAPLIYLGNNTQVTVFNRRAPLMISVPFGSLTDMPYAEYTRLSIAHEICHALFAQLPEIIDEVKRKLTEALITNASPKPSRSRRVIIEMIIGWTEEIWADLFGTALGGIAYVESARRIMTGTAARVGVTDEKHPPAILRPMIHLLALTKIEEQSQGPELKEMRRQLEQDQKDTQASSERVNLLGRQFQSMPALMFVRLGTIGNMLTGVVEKYLLPMQLDTLGGASVVSLLSEVHASNQTTITRPAGAPEFEPWVNEDEIQPGEFVIEFPAGASAVYATPGIFTHPFCCESSILKDWCCRP